MIFERLLRAALVLGALIDGSVAILALFFQNLIEPLLGIAPKDPAITAFLGGELAVVTFLYVAIFRNLETYRPLLLIVALDQALAAIVPGIEIVRGLVPGTIQTIGPIPLSASLAIVLFLGSRRPHTKAA